MVCRNADPVYIQAFFFSVYSWIEDNAWSFVQDSSSQMTMADVFYLEDDRKYIMYFRRKLEVYDEQDVSLETNPYLLLPLGGGPVDLVGGTIGPPTAMPTFTDLPPCYCK